MRHRARSILYSSYLTQKPKIVQGETWPK
jgi:hypothetical protein